MSILHEWEVRASDRHLLQLATPPADPAGINGGCWAARGGSPSSRRIKQEGSARAALGSSLLGHRAFISAEGQDAKL